MPAEASRTVAPSRRGLLFPGGLARPMLRFLAARCTGPGGYYNLGNALGLVSGIAFQVLASRGGPESSVIAVIREYLAGSPGATALSVAMVMFFVSGELYHRAWTNGPDPDAAIVRRADLLSGAAALVLAVSLMLFGSLWLALASTVLLAGGKFGNALVPRGSFPVRVEFLGFDGTTGCRHLDLFRVAALVSRVPAIAAIAVEISRLLAIGTSDASLDLLQSAVLLACYLLWSRADLLLFRHS